MESGLTDFEIEILNRIIPTQTLSNPGGLKMAIRNMLVDKRETLSSQGVTEQDFNLLLGQTGNNIFSFLSDNKFYYKSDAGVVHLTEKGKNLRIQGSVEKYMEWQQQQRIKNASEMNEIQNKGYIAEKQTILNNNLKEVEKKKKRFGFF